MPEEHALLSASGAHRWLHCTPSARLEELLKEKSSEYAEEGRLAHSLGEIKLRKHFTPLKPSEYKKQLKEIQDNPLYASEMNSYTDEYLELVKDCAAGYASKPYVAIEQRLDYSHIAPDGFGTGDCVMIGGNCLIVIDFKYGQGVPVSAEENPQMKLYALGALNVFSLLYNVEYIKLVVFQPRINNTSEWGVSRADLETWGESIKPIAQTAHAGKGEYCAGDHCRFCRAKSLCRTRSVFSQEAFDQYNGMKPPLISPAEVGEILKRADVIKKWIADLEDWTLSELLDNRPVPGWKAVEGRSNRQFADTDLAFGAVKSAGYDEAVLYERKPITLTAVEKLLGKAKFEEVLTPHIIKPPGKPTLAPETDKREAISNKVTAAEAFGKEQ
jgi:hypothetical protein